MKRACLLLACSFCTAWLPAAAQQLEISSSPNVVGSGARALGMGSAFIAVADDATAASWNPGGLTQLERPELSLVYSANWFEEEFDSESQPEIGGLNSVDFDEINYASLVYPVPFTLGGRNFVLSLNYQRQYSFDRDLDFRITQTALAPDGFIFSGGKQQYRQRGGLSTISPAFGFEITDRLSAGAVMNIWDQDLLPDNEWKVRVNGRFYSALRLGQIFALPMPARYQLERDYKNFEGINYTFGVLYKPTARLSLGAVYHTKFTADVDFSERVGRGRKRERPQEYTFPSAVGIGAAYRFPGDKFTLSFDVTRRAWDQFIIEDPELFAPQLRSIYGLIARGNNVLVPLLSLRQQRRTSGISGLPTSRGEIDPTYTFRLGAEYVFVNPKKPEQDYLPSLRGGVFYDPEPAASFEEKWFGRGDVTGEPEDFFGFSFGAGVLVKDRVNLDAAYIYRWGDGVRAGTFPLRRTDAGVDQHSFYLSTVIYF